MDIVLLIIGIVIVLMLGFVIVKVNGVSTGSPDGGNSKDYQKTFDKALVELEILKSKLEDMQRDSQTMQSQQRQELSSSLNGYSKSMSDKIEIFDNRIEKSQERSREIIKDSVKQELNAMDRNINQQIADMAKSIDKQLSAMTENTKQKLDDMDKNINHQLSAMTESTKQKLDDMDRNIRQQMSGMSENNHQQLSGMSENSKQQLSDMNRNINQLLSGMNTTTKQQLSNMSENISNQMKQLENRFSSLEVSTENKLKNIQDTVSRQLTEIRSDNTKKLDEIRGTVDEKLQETLTNRMNESFKLVSERLEQVYKSLGEMQTVAEGVGDLKKVLSNVKTRGILGEIQLGAILKEILTPDQYDENAAVVPNSANRVEFAVKLPGAEDGKYIYLPIDSKFNGDKFANLQNAYDTGDRNLVAAAKKELETAVKKCAKDISEKYIKPPYTTQFGIMFLPFEGLYAEVVNSGLIETLQRDYHVNVAGPSTMAAMLNSLKMGFQTLAIQKRSGEVWEILGAVKTEFGKFEEALDKTQKHIRQVESDLDTLVGTRTRQINRKLNLVEKLDLSESSKILDTE